MHSKFWLLKLKNAYQKFQKHFQRDLRNCKCYSVILKSYQKYLTIFEIFINLQITVYDIILCDM